MAKNATRKHEHHVLLVFLFCGSLIIPWPLFGVRRGFKMILSHRALPSFNMSSYRAIWTHFRQDFIFFEPKIPDPGPKILILVLQISDPGPKIPILVQKNIILSWVHQIVFTGGLPPPRPPALPGGLQAPQTPWRVACSPPCLGRRTKS